MPVLRTSLGVEGFAGCGRPPLRPAPPRPPLRPCTPSSGPAPARGHRSLSPPLMGPPPRPPVGAAEMPPLPPLGVSGCGGCLLAATAGWRPARHVLPRLPSGRRQEVGGWVRIMAPLPRQAQIGQPGRKAAVYSTPPAEPEPTDRCGKGTEQVREACVGGGAHPAGRTPRPSAARRRRRRRRRPAPRRRRAVRAPRPPAPRAPPRPSTWRHPSPPPPHIWP